MGESTCKYPTKPIQGVLGRNIDRHFTVPYILIEVVSTIDQFRMINFHDHYSSE